jgi:hypothetical protein
MALAGNMMICNAIQQCLPGQFEACDISATNFIQGAASLDRNFQLWSASETNVRSLEFGSSAEWIEKVQSAGPGLDNFRFSFWI